MGSFIIKDGDVFTATEPVIVHQVNCMGKMGSGVAKVIKDLYPDHYKYYKKVCRLTDDAHNLLGRYYITTHGDRKIAGVFGQYRYGRDGGLYTNIHALDHGIRSICSKYNAIAVPYLIGCGLGGAPEYTVKSLLEEIADSMNVTIVAYKLK